MEQSICLPIPAEHRKSVGLRHAIRLDPRRQVYDLIVETEKETAFDIYVRIPAWTAGEGTVCVYNTENADELRAVMEGEIRMARSSAQSRVRL